MQSPSPAGCGMSFLTELWSHTGHKSVEKANLTVEPMTTGFRLHLRERWLTVEQAAAEPARSPGRCSVEVNDCSGSGVVQAVADAGRMRDGFLDRVVVTCDHNPAEKANVRPDL